jgi:transcriptional regulator with XRE-family HTH domain
MSIDQVIRAARESRGLTQKDFADALGVSKQVISHWENGARQPSFKWAARMAIEHKDWRHKLGIQIMVLSLNGGK